MAIVLAYRTGATKTDSEQSEPRQTKRVGEGSNAFTNPAHGVWAKARCAIGVCGRKTRCPSSGLVQRERTGELSCGDVRYRADDNARRPGETSLAVKSSTGNRPSRAFLAVRQETVPNREWTG